MIYGRSFLFACTVVAVACVSCDATAPKNCEGVYLVLPKHSDVMVVGRSMPVVAHAYADNPTGGLSFSPKAEVAIRWQTANKNMVRFDGDLATALVTGSAGVSASACGETAHGTITVVPAPYRVTFITQVPTIGVQALNDSGDVVGTSTDAAVPPHFLWRAGDFTSLGNCVPMDVNNHLAVACSGAGPTVWENGIATARDTVAFAFPRFMNDAGHLTVSTGLWRGPDDRVSLGMGDINALSERDHVGGETQTGLYRTPLLWHNGTYRTMPRSGRYGRVTAVNDDGDVGIVSECAPLSGITVGLRAFASNGWTGEVARASGSTVCNDVVGAPVAINNARQIVGEGSQGPYLWSGTKVALLNAVVSAEWQLTSVSGINNRGQILAQGANTRTGQTGLILLDPP